MAATPYPGYPTMRTRSPAAQREPGKPSRMAATPYPGYPTMRVPVARLSAALAGETFPDGGYALSGLPNDAYP
ncbi:hypothetical protein [Klebsiella pneumoniae]|uniref:hypothetical protein n=1 Tax=Klebsiella pneumoniae TaxID=573 RepID=UPI000ABACDF7|nr:hypothetical protein [Klebsiella pneumoniae]